MHHIIVLLITLRIKLAVSYDLATIRKIEPYSLKSLNFHSYMARNFYL